MKALITGAFIATLASGAIAQTVDPVRVEQFRSILADNACILTEDVATDLLPRLGFEKEETRAIVGALVAAGDVRLNGKVLALVDGSCDPADTAAQLLARPDVQQFIAVMAENGCTMSQDSAATVFPAHGMDKSAVRTVARLMMAAGMAQVDPDTNALSVDGAYCPTGGAVQGEVAAPQSQPVAPPQTDPQTSPQATSTEDPRAGVLAMLAANGCAVTQADAPDMIAAAGLDYATSMQILSQMLASGEATSPDGGQTLQVGAPLCAAAGAEPMTPREAFIDLIRQNDCRITAAEFNSLLPANGLDASTAFGLISTLEAEGVISLPPTRDVVTLSAEMCR